MTNTQTAKRLSELSTVYPLNSPQYEGLDPFAGGEDADDDPDAEYEHYSREAEYDDWSDR